jgi:HlyD family secretion protein
MSGGAQSNAALLWYLDAQGELAPVQVGTGISDGQRTEVSGAGLRDGMLVVVGTSTGGQAAAATTGSTNPFQAQQGRQGGGPPGPPGSF